MNLVELNHCLISCWVKLDHSKIIYHVLRRKVGQAEIVWPKICEFDASHYRLLGENLTFWPKDTSQCWNGLSNFVTYVLIRHSLHVTKNSFFCVTEFVLSVFAGEKLF